MQRSRRVYPEMPEASTLWSSEARNWPCVPAVGTAEGVRNLGRVGDMVAGRTLTAKKEKVSKKYQSPFGPIQVDRFAYQSSLGGTTEIPLEDNARMVAASTPRFAKKRIVQVRRKQRRSSGKGCGGESSTRILALLHPIHIRLPRSSTSGMSRNTLHQRALRPTGQRLPGKSGLMMPATA